MTPQFKIIAILALLTVLTVTVIGFHSSKVNEAYDNGFGDAVADMQEKYIKDVEDMMRNKEELLNAAIQESNKWKQKAIELQNRKPVTVTEKEVVEIVKTNTDCKRIIGIDKLFSKLTEANFTD